MAVTNNALDLTSQGLAYYNGTGTFTAPTITQYAVIIGTTANDVANTNVGTNGTVLIGNTGANPSFSATVSSLTITGLTATTASIGTATITNLVLTNPLSVANGGTGTTSFTPYGVTVAGSTSTAPLSSIDLTAGQVLIGTSTSPVAASLTAGTGISITTGQGSITITNTEAAGGGVVWLDEATSFTAAPGTGYFVSAVATATLPNNTGASHLGDTVIIYYTGSSGAVSIISANATATIRIGTADSTAATGSVVNTAQGDSLTLTYHDTDNEWYCRGVQGNWTVN
jgi:hypothetical protein